MISGHHDCPDLGIVQLLDGRLGLLLDPVVGSKDYIKMVQSIGSISVFSNVSTMLNQIKLNPSSIPALGFKPTTLRTQDHESSPLTTRP